MTYKTGSWGEQAKERYRKRKASGELEERYRKKSVAWAKYKAKYIANHPQYLKDNNEKCLTRHHKVRRQVLEKLGNKCSRCGFDDVRALQIDHVNGGGTKERKKESTQAIHRRILEDKDNKYQLLCANCNWIKRVERNEVK